MSLLSLWFIMIVTFLFLVADDRLKPFIIREPETVTSLKNDNVSLICTAGSTSDVQVTMLWKKDKVCVSSELLVTCLLIYFSSNPYTFPNSSFIFVLQHLYKSLVVDRNHSHTHHPLLILMFSSHSATISKDKTKSGFCLENLNITLQEIVIFV